ncbi:putative bifunctional diguanylate cyclase/phosphodiesterase [Stackebrandtia soli]|uniref:putative bifunctional diguanylate cyclase/phosphodiesterase n=1 Tax=Stackebrandtia soli TaxID=1892856 RepID=UPI0039ED3E7C
MIPLIRLPRRLVTLLPVVLLSTLLASALTVSVWPGPPDATGIATAVAACVASVSSVLVWRISTPLPSAAERAPYRRLSIALGVGSVGVAVSLLVGEGARVGVITGTGVVMVALFAVAMMRLPHDVVTPAARLRRTLDGLFIAGCVLFSVWVAVATSAPVGFVTGNVPVTAMISCAAGMCGVGIVAMIRAAAHRRRYLLLVTSLTIMAMAHVGVVVAVASPQPERARLVMIVVWAVGCLIAAGVACLAQRHPGPAAAVPMPRVDSAMSIVPAVTASVATVYHGFVNGSLGVDAVVLAMIVVWVLSARQVLARKDVRRSVEKLAERESYFRSIITGSSDITTVLDGNRRVRWQAASTTWRLRPESTMGMPFTELVHPDDAAAVDRKLIELLKSEPGSRIRVDARIRHRDGKWRDTESAVTDQRNVKHVRGLVVHTRDVTDRRGLERELAKLAYTDTLTSLSNRRALLRTLHSDVAGGSMPCSLLAIDLDGFKNVNDTQGHDIGDAVLVEVARRLAESLRPTDVAARLGGDEFAILLWCSPHQSYEIAERLLETLSHPYPIGPATVYLSASIGVAACGTATDVETLLRNADLALRSAKQSGKNRIETFDARFERRVRRKTTLEQELRGAIDRGELSLVYQPVFSLPERRIVGAEALMRWQHHTLGAVSPAEFIPIMEEAALSTSVTSWTLRMVAERLATWRDLGLSTWVSINLSVRQLHSPLFATNLAQALIERGVPPARLVVEVTEHDVAQDMDVLVAQLGALRGAGVRIALDDFGAGYSSLGQLHRLPVDILKLDRDLVAGSDHGAAPLADVVARLGERLGLAVIAEGVETQAQLDVVEQSGCGMVQGYYFARPMSVDQIDAALRRQAAPVSPLAIES